MSQPTLSSLIEDLRVLTLDHPWPAFFALTRLIDLACSSPELERLTNDELRAIKGFRITLHRSATMEPDTMLKHVSAHWLGNVNQAVLKLSIGPDAERYMAAMNVPDPAQVSPSGWG